MADQLISTAEHERLPESYVRSETQRPRLDEVVADAHIPVVDLADPDRAAVIAQIGEACRTHGFFQVLNHGVPVELMLATLAVAYEFFRLPAEEKAKLYSDDPAKKIRLSTSFNVRKETVHNWRDYLRLHCHPLEQYVPDWPTNPPSFRPSALFFLGKSRLLIAKYRHHGVPVELMLTTLEHTVAFIDGGAYTSSSQCSIKVIRREVCSGTPSNEATRPLRWSEAPITFSIADHPASTAGVGRLPLLVSPTICNVKVGRVLIDGGAGLNLLSKETFEKLQVPYRRLKPSLPFCGVTSGYSLPLGQVELPVTFGSWENFRTEDVIFDVVELPLPYNAILGRPALARFMMAAHYAYLTVKMPGPAGLISVSADTGGAVSCAEQSYLALVSAQAEVEDRPGGPGPSSSKLRLAADASVPTKKVVVGEHASQVLRIGSDLDGK